MKQESDLLPAANRFVSLFDEITDSCPEWIKNIHENSILRFKEKGFPGSKNESYKFSHDEFSLIGEFDYEETEEVPFTRSQLLSEKNIDRGALTVITINGRYSESLNSDAAFPEGMIVGNLCETGVQEQNMISSFLNVQAGKSEDALVDLNNAFFRDGLFLCFPSNVVIDKPVCILNVNYSKRPAFSAQRNLIVLGTGSKVSILYEDVSAFSEKMFSDNVTEIFIDSYSSLNFCEIQDLNDESRSVHSIFTNQKDNSFLQTEINPVRGAWIRNNLKVAIDGEFSEAKLYGLSVIGEDQHFDQYTKVDHIKANGSSDQHYKYMLEKNARGSFYGRIHVFRDAQKTNAYQKNNNILFTEKAVMNTRPQLIIDADDVKCSHGATIGQIDEEALFYMQQRGIGKDEAKMLMMNAFAGEVIDKFKNDKIKKYMTDMVTRKLGGAKE
ncbi:MAG: Fe-S cluster assembly protein SufD [Prolixibacteraceae bacterium]|nr:Fe-S cluster assembly protein SufD [Prolixibacteraceae bacterium]